MKAVQTLLPVVLFVAACDSNGSRDPKDDFISTYNVTYSRSSFIQGVTNPFFPLTPGTKYHFESETEDGLETIDIEVLAEARKVDGVNAVVVRDRAYLDGTLIEDTYDWFAQDQSGNVWYLGEDTKAYENGKVVSTEGSWETGVDGARAGIIMPAQPSVGQAYYQEIYAGIAEDRGQIVSFNETISVPYGTFTGCIKTEDTTPLEPDLLEYKWYCPGVGLTLEEEAEDGVQVRLVTMVEP